jgi:hypothetical protein
MEAVHQLERVKLLKRNSPFQFVLLLQDHSGCVLH